MNLRHQALNITFSSEKENLLIGQIIQNHMNLIRLKELFFKTEFWNFYKGRMMEKIFLN